MLPACDESWWETHTSPFERAVQFANRRQLVTQRDRGVSVQNSPLWDGKGQLGEEWERIMLDGLSEVYSTLRVRSTVNGGYDLTRGEGALYLKMPDDIYSMPTIPSVR